MLLSFTQLFMTIDHKAFLFFRLDLHSLIWHEHYKGRILICFPSPWPHIFIGGHTYTSAETLTHVWEKIHRSEYDFMVQEPAIDYPVSMRPSVPLM